MVSVFLFPLCRSCDSGFGNRLAVELANKGFSVYAGCITEGAIKTLGAIEGITAVKMDVTKQADIDAVIERIKTDHPNGLWAVVNNAGRSNDGCGALGGGMESGSSSYSYMLESHYKLPLWPLCLLQVWVLAAY